MCLSSYPQRRSMEAMADSFLRLIESVGQPRETPELRFGSVRMMNPNCRFSGSHVALQTSCWFQNCWLLRTTSFARANAPFEESLLHGTAGQRQRRAEVLARRVVSPAAQLKLPKRRRVKRIARKAIAILDRTDRLEPALRTFVLRDRNGAATRHHRRGPHRHQRVVE